MAHCLQDKIITAIEIAADKEAIRFLIQGGEPIIARCDADCCSSTWVEHIKPPGLGFPAKVLSCAELELPGSQDNHPEHDCLQVYGFKILTDKGDIVIDYRNSSNGYYGGTKEHHFGKNVWLTRKGAVRARQRDMGIIPGSMGVRSFIVRGKGNEQSFCSCSHGAGRKMSRTQAKKLYSVEDHKRATEGVECKKDESVIDETPMAYKNIDAVMAAQSDLVEIVHTLKQVVCVKG